jgi:hypothetical protein
MSEIGIIRNVLRAEQASKTLDDVLPKTPPKTVTTATGRTIDISRGYNVRGPDGSKIPFKKDTSLDKAKEWTKNFYNPGEIEETKGKIGIKGGGGFITYNQTPDAMRVTMAQVTEKGTGKGAGLYKKLFESAKRQGMKVQSDTAMSEGSVAVWLRFKELGYNIVEYPRKRMMSGGYENAKNPSMPLFEFVPTNNAPAKQAAQPQIDIPIEQLDREVYSASRKGMPAEQREKVHGLYDRYRATDDPKEKADIANEIRTVLPKSETNE